MGSTLWDLFEGIYRYTYIYFLFKSQLYSLLLSLFKPSKDPRCRYGGESNHML